jgi:hypothetical protein
MLYIVDLLVLQGQPVHVHLEVLAHPITLLWTEFPEDQTVLTGLWGRISTFDIGGAMIWDW